jgi:hypothetical protein
MKHLPEIAMPASNIQDITSPDVGQSVYYSLKFAKLI